MKSVLDMGCGDGQLLEAPAFFQVMNFKQPMDLDGSEIRQTHQLILGIYVIPLFTGILHHPNRG